MIYLRDYVTSLIAIIIGNKMYEKSLTSITNKHINWLSKTDSPLLANKYNRVQYYRFRIIGKTFQQFDIYSLLPNKQL